MHLFLLIDNVYINNIFSYIFCLFSLSLIVYKYFEEPIKAISLRSGKIQSHEEIVITQSGIEGGGIYSLSPAIKKGEAVVLDLLPNWNEKQLNVALQKPLAKAS